MADPNERDAKLIQYMQEAYGKEQELELALQADLLITTKDAYSKRLKQHLKETKAHAKALERRIKKLGGGGGTVQKLVGKATAVAKAPLHAVRGSGEQEKMLKNAKTQYTAEQEEISTYLALETFAGKVNDSETAKLARDIRRDEERMARFLESQVRQLAGAVATTEVPAAQRRAPGKAKRSSAKRSTAKPAAKKSSAKSTAKKSTAKKSTAKKASAKKSTARKSSAKKSTAKKSTARKSSKAKATSKKAAAKSK
jgi:ferritin-like metal-binding protein YciE